MLLYRLGRFSEAAQGFQQVTLRRGAAILMAGGALPSLVATLSVVTEPDPVAEAGLIVCEWRLGRKAEARQRWQRLFAFLSRNPKWWSDAERQSFKLITEAAEILGEKPPWSSRTNSVDR